MAPGMMSGLPQANLKKLGQEGLGDEEAHSSDYLVE